jgi:hypothetical protein
MPVSLGAAKVVSGVGAVLSYTAGAGAISAFPGGVEPVVSLEAAALSDGAGGGVSDAPALSDGATVLSEGDPLWAATSPTKPPVPGAHQSPRTRSVAADVGRTREIGIRGREGGFTDGADWRGEPAPPTAFMPSPLRPVERGCESLQVLV